MNKQNAAQYLPLIQALIDGKQIQVKFDNCDAWDSIDDFSFNYSPECYRIKPERKTITRWVNVYHNGLNCVVCNTKEEAEYGHVGSRIACVPVTITYEEGEGL